MTPGSNPGIVRFAFFAFFCIFVFSWVSCITQDGDLLILSSVDKHTNGGRSVYSRSTEGISENTQQDQRREIVAEEGESYY